jgi:acetyl/propionyl-CoA carboxylase alpha subunit
MASGLRVGSAQGHRSPPYYDPLLAKLIAYGANRTQAVRRRQDPLASCLVQGVHTNLALLQRILQQARFQVGDLATDFLERLLARQ